jgi:hypothetical protein
MKGLWVQREKNKKTEIALARALGYWFVAFGTRGRLGGSEAICIPVLGGFWQILSETLLAVPSRPSFGTGQDS